MPIFSGFILKIDLNEPSEISDSEYFFLLLSLFPNNTLTLETLPVDTLRLHTMLQKQSQEKPKQTTVF